jgi:hypothetical protein
MTVGKTIRKVSDLKAQRLETYRYWQSRTSAERIDAVSEIIRSTYLAKGIDIDLRPTDRTLVRVERPAWKGI